MMRRVVVVALCALCTVGAAACGSAKDSSAGSDTAKPSKPVADKPLVEDGVDGVGEVTLVEPKAGGGEMSTKFSWKPVDGAATYRIAVMNAAGEPSWSMSTTDTNATYPKWRSPKGNRSWTVVALDGKQHVVAASGIRKL